MEFKSLNEVLDYAIGQEEEAYNFYNKIANSIKFTHMRKVFMEFARQEEGHKAKLLEVKAGKTGLPADKTVTDLKIGDHLVDITITPDLNYQEALIVAMKAEKNAYMMYTGLAEVSTEPGLKELFRSLAIEEANHKLRFELEYDEQFMGEN